MLRALVLGIVQGLTEFLPVSSSAHLVLVPHFAGWSRPGLAFDVALHVGTLLAVVWHFRRDLLQVARSLLGLGDDPAEGRRLLGLLVVGSLPVAAAGLLLESTVERAFGEPIWTAGFLLVTALLLVLGERTARPAEEEPPAPRAPIPPAAEGRVVGWGDAVVMGLAQAAALFPGVSRSGSTISAGMMRGVGRQVAARFSFLLSIPAILGAVVVQLPDLAAADVPPIEVLVGVVAAFVSGLWAIRFLLRVITTRGLHGFAAYVTVVAVVVLALSIT